jgi:outer membrane immunogenic protein
MKRVLLATAGILAIAAVSSASAADLPARYPTKAPAYVAQVYNWTGFYVGAHLGWARVDLSETVVAAPAGFGTGTVSGRDDGFIYGGQVGFNYQIGQFVLGVEGQLSGADIGSSGTVVTVVAPATTLTVTGTSSVDWMATLAARFGVAFGNALFYGKAGFAWMDWSSSAVGTSTTGGVVTTIGTTTGGGTETGYMLGVGLEYGFTPNWSAKIEYNYLDFGNERRTGGGFTVDSDLTTHLVKAGINYRFGGAY